MDLKIEYLLMVLSILFFLSILAGRISSRLGVPALLLFLGVGMLFGSDGLGIQFENFYIAQHIGTVALCIILFAGGMDTKFHEIKPVLVQGVLLATVGVLLTAGIAGVCIWWIMGMTYPSAAMGLTGALLLSAIMSSTDSASVFSILRSKGLALKNNLRPTLELESGSNDPVAYILVITLIEIIKLQGTLNYWQVAGTLALQLIIGLITGYAIGKLAVWTINRIRIDNDSLYPILLFTFSLFIFSFTYFVGGNSFLAIYIGGLVIGNSKFVHKRSSLGFFDGLAWLSQLIMFLTLGLLVNPRELLPVLIPGLIISLLMIFVSRPLSVFITLWPFKHIRLSDKTFISWVGLRGAVPIIFAIMPLAENIPYARTIFNIVFLSTLVSLLLQGTTLPLIARWLGVDSQPEQTTKPSSFDFDFSEDIKSVTSEIEITDRIIAKGNRLLDLNLPDNTLVVMVKRNDSYFIPTGKTVLQTNDKLLIITDHNDALMETYKMLGNK